jgi:hypothetical protein
MAALRSRKLHTLTALRSSHGRTTNKCHLVKLSNLHDSCFLISTPKVTHSTWRPKHLNNCGLCTELPPNSRFSSLPLSSLLNSTRDLLFGLNWSKLSKNIRGRVLRRNLFETSWSLPSHMWMGARDLMAATSWLDSPRSSDPIVSSRGKASGHCLNVSKH